MAIPSTLPPRRVSSRATNSRPPRPSSWRSPRSLDCTAAPFTWFKHPLEPNHRVELIRLRIVSSRLAVCDLFGHEAPPADGGQQGTPWLRRISNGSLNLQPITTQYYLYAGLRSRLGQPMTGSCAPVLWQARAISVEVRLLKLQRDVRSAASQYGEDAKSYRPPLSRNKMRGARILHHCMPYYICFLPRTSRRRPHVGWHFAAALLVPCWAKGLMTFRRRGVQGSPFSASHPQCLSPAVHSRVSMPAFVNSPTGRYAGGC